VTASRSGPSPFGAHDYDIQYGRLAASREVRIKARRACPPAVGDTLTFDRPEGLYDLLVTELTAGPDGWSARCRVVDLRPG
jgi:hypothetical protein